MCLKIIFCSSPLNFTQFKRPYRRCISSNTGRCDAWWYAGSHWTHKAAVMCWCDQYAAFRTNSTRFKLWNEGTAVHFEAWWHVNQSQETGRDHIISGAPKISRWAAENVSDSPSSWLLLDVLYNPLRTIRELGFPARACTWWSSYFSSLFWELTWELHECVNLKTWKLSVSLLHERWQYQHSPPARLFVLPAKCTGHEWKGFSLHPSQWIATASVW